MLVGGDLSLQPLQIRSTVAAAAIGGIVHIAYASPLGQGSGNPKDDAANPGQLVGVALSFGPGQALSATVEQKAAGWDVFVAAIPESLRRWWVEYVRLPPCPSLPAAEGRVYSTALLYPQVRKMRSEVAT